jgi:hypoxanthine phosphoribosyltransferase
MTPEVPAHYNLELNPDQIRELVAKMAEEITPWAVEAYEKTQTPPLAVCILRGGVLFFSDLVRAIPVSMQLAFCVCRSYSSETNEALRDTIQVEMDKTVIAGRAVLLIDDICDSGGTFKYLEHFVLKHGAVDVRTAAFVFRDHHSSIFRPNYAAYTYAGDEWFVGYGMEDRNAYMNLPGLYKMAPMK